MASIRKQTEYVLMSKDTAVLSFLCKRNEFDEPNFREVACHADYRPIPVSYTHLTLPTKA